MRVVTSRGCVAVLSTVWISCLRVVSLCLRRSMFLRMSGECALCLICKLLIRARVM